ncbi:MAG: Ig-like domain-containing protein [Anaerolineae bacterium]|nr:Ig-like domain-containing protein [Anaerolineae bacterium]
MFSTPHLKSPSALRSILALAVAVLAISGLAYGASAWRRDTVVAAPSSCPVGTVPSLIETDLTLSGDQFVATNVTIRNGATLTLTPGTAITMCGPYALTFSNGALHAEGTAVDPITIAGETPATRWERIFFNGSADRLLSSTLRHVILDGGGGSDPAADYGALHIYDAGVSTGPGPVVEAVTIRNSGAYGVYVRVPSDDTTPPLLSGLTITDSAAAPLLIWASAVSGLGTGNTFTGNGVQAVEVRAGTVLGGGVSFDQTWQRQPVPYRMVGNGGGLAVTGSATTTPTLTLLPGTALTLDADFTISVVWARLVAEGTPEEPITFEPTDPAEHWHRIYFNGSAGVVPASTLRHVVLDGGGGTVPLVEDATVNLYAPNGTEAFGPVFDAVTITNSSASGLLARVTESDSSPMLASNLTITGSARTPLRLYAASVSGLGGGNTLTGNADDAIEVVASGSLGGSLDFDATWHAQPVPYRLLNFLNVSHARSPVLTIAPGTSLEMATGAGFWVNSAGLVIAGTPTAPITITRSPATAAWNRIYFEANVNPASRLAHVTIEYAGGVNGAIDYRGDTIDVDHVTVRYATNAGLFTGGTFVQVQDSVFEQNGEGLRFQYGAGGVLRDNVIRNNTSAGLTVLSNTGNVCVDAMGNYWGASNGPAEAAATLDACNLTTTNAGAGDAVSADAIVSPWLSEPPGGGPADASQIAAQDFWVIADGVQTTTLTVRARDAQGAPLVGKQIVLQTTRGTLDQPTAPTDAQGVTTAVIRSTQAGAALVTAYNVTDDRPLAALAALNFWQGSGDNAGLVPPGGAPYASPRLIIEGKPFQAGLPITFRLPMQNSNPVPVDVKVVYSVSRLNIGMRFTPVYTVETTLAPGEAWDAPGIWVSLDDGHQCVIAEIEVTLPDGQVTVMTPQVVVNVGPFQVNIDKIPPDPCGKLDAESLIPRGAGVKGVRKHVQKMLIQTYLINACLNQMLGGDDAMALRATAAAALRDYESVAPPPTITMPQLVADAEVTQAEADAINAVGDTVAELMGIDIAIATARQRAQEAGQADDANAVSLQLTAFRDYMRARGAALTRLSARLESYLALARDAGIPDTTFTPADYAAYLAELMTVGYDAETIAFHQAVGRSLAEIQTQLELEILALQENPFYTTTFYTILREVRDAASAQGATIAQNYGQPGLLAQALGAGASEGLHLGTLTTDFAVGNPRETVQTVALRVRPVQLPLDWTYRLSATSLLLQPGESTTVTLTVDVGRTVVQDSLARLAVEGFIGADLIGGILFEQEVPRPAMAIVYLPLVIRGGN